MKRQNIRKLLLLISLLLFPVTFYYLSPAIIINGAVNGIITGSFISFILMMVLSIIFGRAFCSYLCPAGGLQEAAFEFNGKKAKLGKRKYIKYVIWVIWITCIVISFLSHGGIEKADEFYMTNHGVSVSDLQSLIIFYIVLLVLLIPGLIWGKRATCHYFCWMAPFMEIGIKLRKLLHLPGLHIAAEQSKCISCGQCSKNCPMSLEVAELVHKGTTDNYDCILCGVCVDTCPKKVLQYRFSKSEKK